LVTLPGIKKGDTFSYSIIWEGAIASELRSEIKRKNGGLVAQVNIDETETAGTFILSVMDTSDWPTGILQTDIRRTVDSYVQTSETMEFVVERGVTQ
jgi:hypothetical protein